MDNNKNILMGLDISTTCIGICLMEYDEINPYGKIIELTHVNPKVTKKNKVESLFLKKRIFQNEFLSAWKNKGITRVIIESPLLQSNNVNTVGTLLQFNGMISDCVYEVLGIVPEYISSYDARKYSFPELLDVRKFAKNGEPYKKEKIIKAIEKNNFTLFGGFPWDIDKKTVIQNKVAELFPNINWLYDKHNELKKENFDACDAYVACLGYINKEKYGEIDIEAKIIEVSDDKIKFTKKFWDKSYDLTISIK
jgi:hypothetical protein